MEVKTVAFAECQLELCFFAGMSLCHPSSIASCCLSEAWPNPVLVCKHLWNWYLNIHWFDKVCGKIACCTITCASISTKPRRKAKTRSTSSLAKAAVPQRSHRQWRRCDWRSTFVWWLTDVGRYWQLQSVKKRQKLTSLENTSSSGLWGALHGGPFGWDLQSEYRGLWGVAWGGLLFGNIHVEFSDWKTVMKLQVEASAQCLSHSWWLEFRNVSPPKNSAILFWWLLYVEASIPVFERVGCPAGKEACGYQQGRFGSWEELLDRTKMQHVWGCSRRQGYEIVVWSGLTNLIHSKMLVGLVWSCGTVYFEGRFISGLGV